MTGSGDPAFVKNFNPFTATSLPSGIIRQGCVLRAADRHDARRRRPSVPMAGAELEVVEREQDPHAFTGAERQVVRRRAAHLGRRRLHPHGRQAGQGDGPDRALPARNEHRLGEGERPVRRRDQPEDPRLAVHRCEPERGRDPAAAHLVEGREAGHLPEPGPGRLGPVHPDQPLHDPELRPGQEPELLAGRDAEDPLPRVPAGVLQRRGAPADQERQGRLDAQLRPERREGLLAASTRSTTTPSTRRPPIRSA